jgi:hypothetical protein
MQMHLLWHNAGSNGHGGHLQSSSRLVTAPFAVCLVEPILPARTGGVVFFSTDPVVCGPRILPVTL